MRLREMDEQTTSTQQLQQDAGRSCFMKQQRGSAVAAPHVFQKVAVPGICVA